MKERITKILEHFFITEPAIFSVLCTHELAENTRMACPVRCGRRRVEFNPEFVFQMTDEGLEEALKTEGIRILLKHPYERKPDQCCDQAIALGSNITIGDQYHYGNFKIEKPQDFGLEYNRPYEWYSRKIQELLPPGDGNGDGDGNGWNDSPRDEDTDNGKGKGLSKAQEHARSNSKKFQDLSALWEEDEMAVAMINGIIGSMKNWGSLAGNMAEAIIASTKAKIDWRNVFAGFRASVLSSKRKLTRMKPNRRTGFDNMGSTRLFTTRLLVAVDVSGSISSEALSYFYGVVNSAFRYGFEAIDVIQFDCGITQVQSLKKCMKDVVAVGRGGTSFDEPILYAHEKGYDGLLILTDGYAPEPAIPEGKKCKIIWVCEDKSSYEKNHKWMAHSGRVCTIELH